MSNMIYLILLLIDTLAIFFQGFSFRRENIPMFLISSLIVFFVAGSDIILKGTDVYISTILNADIYTTILSIAYVLFFLISGYIVGGFQIIKDEQMKIRLIKFRHD